MKPQRGILLLPVAIMLAITGALAYTMTRQGAMSVAEVNRQYDLEAARYLAEAGLRLVRWQNEKEGCTSARTFASVKLPGMEGTVGVTEMLVKSGEMTMTATAAGPLGATSAQRREKLKMFDRRVMYTVEVPASDGDDTFIKSGSAVTQGSALLLEATDDMAYPLIEFSLGKVPRHSRVVRAELSLYQVSSQSVQAERSLSVHTPTRDWKEGDATWAFPWTAPGGDYNPVAEATVAITGNGRYAWRIEPLVRRWIDGAQPNYGVLLKPSGLNDARFHSVENGSEKPRIMVDYYLRCS